MITTDDEDIYKLSLILREPPVYWGTGKTRFIRLISIAGTTFGGVSLCAARLGRERKSEKIFSRCYVLQGVWLGPNGGV